MPVWDEILRRITPRAETRAYLDWTTGIIRINTTREAWGRLLARGPDARLTPEEQGLLELFVHEAYHAVQLFTTGYLYNFATQITVEVTEWLRSVDLREALTATVPAELSESIRSWIAPLDEPGPEGVTTRSIVESGAFLVQKRTFDSDLPHAAYVKLLDASGRPPAYREAYDLASGYLGEAAIDAYPLLASLALCTLEPPTTFVALCAGARRHGYISLSPGGTSVEIEGLLELAKSGGFLQTASSLAGQLAFAHPIYQEGAREFNRLAGSDIYKTCALMLMPHQFWTYLGDLVLQLCPFVFNDPQGLSMTPPERWSAMSPDERNRSATELVAVAAICARVVEGDDQDQE